MERKRQFDQIDIYPVTSKDLSMGKDNATILREVTEGGAKIIQLREKNISMNDFYQQALFFRQWTRKHQLLFIINDHIDIAIKVDADGIHLGQSDMPLKEARALSPNLLIGASCHSTMDIIKAQKEDIDYINLGPIFPTQTKKVSMTPLGPYFIKDNLKHITLPFTVMGGINKNNIHDVLNCGAKKIAVVSAIVSQSSPEDATKFLRRSILSQ